MKLFSCAVCRQLLFFENVKCGSCGHSLAYLPEHEVVSALAPEGGGWRALAPEAAGARYQLCANSAEHGVCNWALPAGSDARLCRSCRLNDTIPNLSAPDAWAAWQRLEIAKRRLLYTLFALGLPVEAKGASERGLAFSFKADRAGEKVYTGHDDGLITINVAEADDPFREKMRHRLGEAYRTLLGHFRHEIGHYYWERLVRGTAWHEPFRREFGDESSDYAQALEAHYARGAPPSWQDEYVSAYASMHPWEDFAETFAHYLHIVDTLETARSYGLALQPQPRASVPLARVTTRRLAFEDFDELVAAWLPLTMALNSLNRGMGLPDLYPFVLSPRSLAKLRFVHVLIDAESRPAPAV
jgi:hypothetical protein